MSGLRIAVGGIKHESNGFSTMTTSIQDFKVAFGEAVLPSPVREEFRNLMFIPTMSAAALPGGYVAREAYLELRGKLLGMLESSLPVDGIYLDLHGAMEVEGVGDGETDLLLRLRELVGWDTPIAVSLDLHGNVTARLVELADVITAYRTAPHRDYVETARRAVRLLVNVVRCKLRTVRALVKIPLMLPGEYAVTDVEPSRSLYGRLVEYGNLPGVVDCSILVGCAWTDSPHCTFTVLAITEGDKLLASKLACKLAGEVWSRRKEFKPEVEALPFKEALEKALSFPEKPVFISDSGDNVTAGGAGDLPVCLGEMLELGVEDAVVAGICDREAVDECVRAGEGSRLKLGLGGKLDRVNGKPLEVEGFVLKTVVSRDNVRTSILRVDGVDVILTAERKPFLSPRDFYELGVDPARYKVVVVKMGYLFPELRKISKRYILALTPGFTDLKLERLPYKRVLRPVYPLDKEFEWRPEALCFP